MSDNDGFFGKLFGNAPPEEGKPAAPTPPRPPGQAPTAPGAPRPPGAPGAPSPLPGAPRPPQPGAPTGQPQPPRPPGSPTGIPAGPQAPRPPGAAPTAPGTGLPAAPRPAAPTMGGRPTPGPGKSDEDAFNINDLLALVVEKGGSDLHLTVGTPPMMRLQGRLWPTDLPPLQPKDTKRLIFQFLTNDQRERFERDLELDISYEIPDLSRFRCNVFNNRLGIGAVFRVIPTRIKTLAELKMPPVLSELARRTKGLVLVTGPTGSGKSTTLAAMIDQINNERQDHILTIEDPIEFVHQHKSCIVNQREIGPNTKSFAAALRSALREDPDIILVGEMRDYETISLAVTAAETGHLVFATLHTPSAAQSVDRIVDVFPAHQQDQIRTQLADALQGILAQQLIPTMDGMSRVVALEILINTPAVANLIRENKTFQLPSIMQTSKQIGMQTMDQSLMDLVKSRRIAPEEAYRRAFDKKAFEQYKPK
ncbi:MAG: Twitching motility protein PilT [Candidatus Ozemobacter sibiricus]|uniref:Twitching motility protein PilT n=1 Tax=Candidatus Ozemobacter sibiricus TaxID=2268124 RepID=A0A367ZJ71_9BACT|nr:MAG: Twitching motility protein PilT [Candidatus Ozemobacter sibiricus]